MLKICDKNKDKRANETKKIQHQLEWNTQSSFNYSISLVEIGRLREKDISPN